MREDQNTYCKDGLDVGNTMLLIGPCHARVQGMVMILSVCWATWQS